MTVIDEPFYGFWLKRIGKTQPHFNEILSSVECDDPDKVHDKIEASEKIKGNVFAKNMANTVAYMNMDRLVNYRHVFLIRDPAETITSHIKVDSLITSEDLCLEHQVKLYDWVKEKTKDDPIVVNGMDLRKDPTGTLTRLCGKLNLPYTDAMLSWPAGPKNADGVWAQAWYNDVHGSTGFNPPSSKSATRSDLPSNFIPLYDEVAPYYKRLLSYCI